VLSPGECEGGCAELEFWFLASPLAAAVVPLVRTMLLEILLLLLLSLLGGTTTPTRSVSGAPLRWGEEDCMTTGFGFAFTTSCLVCLLFSHQASQLCLLRGKRGSHFSCRYTPPHRSLESNQGFVGLRLSGFSNLPIPVSITS